MKFSDEIISKLPKGGVGVLPTDTVYGLMGLAVDERAVKKIYSLKEREAQKPSVVLIADLEDLGLFGVELSYDLRNKLSRLWPARVSVILPVKHRFSHLVQGPLGTHAFRVPPHKELRRLIEQVGPLIAPSANLSNQSPAKNLAEARAYFGERVDFYVDGGVLNEDPSTVVLVEKDGSITIKRQGADLDKVKDIFIS